MPTPAVLLQEVVSRIRPAANPDSIRDGVPGRCGRYGEDYALNLIQKAHLLADEGSYFVSTNPTPGTGIAGQAAPTAAPTAGSGNDTKPFLVIQNLAQAGDPAAPRLYLDYLRLRTTAAGANGTAINVLVQLDTIAARIAGGAAIGGTNVVPLNPNMDSGGKSVAKVDVGNLTVTGSSANCRVLPNIQLRGVLTVVNDIYILSFGPSEYGVGSLISSGTTVAQQSFGYPPVVIGPQQCALIHLWMPAQTGASSFEFDLGAWEREE